MIQDINNIETYETITKSNTTKWRPIYEVIDESYIEDSNNFPGAFIRDCKNNSNKANGNRTNFICTSCQASS